MRLTPLIASLASKPARVNNLGSSPMVGECSCRETCSAAKRDGNRGKLDIGPRQLPYFVSQIFRPCPLMCARHWVKCTYSTPCGPASCQSIVCRLTAQAPPSSSHDAAARKELSIHAPLQLHAGLYSLLSTPRSEGLLVGLGFGTAVILGAAAWFFFGLFLFGFRYEHMHTVRFGHLYANQAKLTVFPSVLRALAIPLEIAVLGLCHFLRRMGATGGLGAVGSGCRDLSDYRRDVSDVCLILT
ncbi:hypothetical protein QBC43DRAFT_142739 [Cladorrhinum sp. PSN259]|nr:hypothetical protein QBC43DRAFT_142739 [Cladorrhinum sp. PSN259]